MPAEFPIAPHAGPLGRAAGIMFLTPDGETLLLRRGDGGDFPGTFGFPGGHVEEGETDEQAARRECLEETGFAYEGGLERFFTNGQFVGFLARRVEKFSVTLCDESTGFVWCNPADAPTPLHPGCDRAFRIAAAHTELDIARLIRDGDIPSPQPFGGSMFFALRITGTGHAYRSGAEEHAWRDPSMYLNDEFLARCNGLPVVWQHPRKGNTLDTKSMKTMVGTIMLPYLQGNEVWGIARIIDLHAFREMEGKQLSTSPNCVFDSASGNVKVPLIGEAPLLIEGNPYLIDHLAVCELGVWDKGGPPEGVQVDQLKEVQSMPDQTADTTPKPGELSQDAVLAAIAALGTTLGSRMDGVTARMDSFEKNMPAKTLTAAADAKKDADEAEEKAKKDAEEQAKKDADEAEEKAKKDAEELAKKDAEEKAKKAEEDCKMDADPEAYADAQSRADSVYQLHSKSAPRPMEGEKLMAYRARLVRVMQPHSATYKDSNLTAIGDPVAFSVAEAAIYADAATASHRIGLDSAGRLRAITRVDQDTGHRVTTFAGKAGDWCADFKAPAQLAEGGFHPRKQNGAH